MGCAASLRSYGAAEDDRDDVRLWVCRDRKRLMKSAVDRRYALAGAHSNYNHSLYAVALALRLFVARHSFSAASSSSFLITFPEPSPNPTMHLHPTQSKPNATNDVVITSPEEAEPVCEHFYDDDVDVDEVGPAAPQVAMTSALSRQQNENEFGGGWDFFNPFDNLTVTDGEERQNPAAEDGGCLKIAAAGAKVGLEVAALENGDGNDRDLLEALKDVEGHFVKAYEFGVEFGKMLEFNSAPSLHNFDLQCVKSKETSEKFVPSIAWHKSSLTGSPSCRSLLSRSSSRSSSTWTGINSTTDLFEDSAGMESGSHSSTLGRLYAWEKKLYDEVKAGNEMKRIYERKTSRLNNENASNKRGIEDEVNDLCSRILVSMKITDSISKRIDKMRDEELQPQLIELLHGLTKTWKAMLESHKIQSRTMFEVKTFACTALSNDASHHLATLQLEAEVQNWRTSFSSYISATKAYVEALSEWAYKATSLENEFHNPPPVYTMCRDWLTVMKNLPDESVTYAMKRFAKDLQTLWAQQAMEQQQKRKVDRLLAESKKRVAGFEREERKMLESKNSRKNTEVELRNKVDVLAAKKAQLDAFTNKLEKERAKHQNCIEETRRLILVVFQTGFSSVFDSLSEFCEPCARKSHDVAENVKMGILGHDGKMSKMNPILR